jgi:AraC-like DNA-binding protein
MSQPPAFPFLILGTGGRIFDPDIWDGREHLAKFEQDCWALTFFDCESWVIGERSGNGPMVICAESQAEAATIIGPRKVCWIHLQPPASGVDETDPLELFSGAPNAVIDDARVAVLRDHFEEAFRLRNTVEYSSTRFYLLTASALLHLDGIQPNDLAYDLFCFARAGLSRGLTVQHLADHFEMDRSSFTRWLEQLTGISPGQWLRILRLHCAAIRVWQKGE